MDDAEDRMKTLLRNPTLTIAQAADRLGVSVRRVRAWLYQRKLGAFRGRLVRIPEVEIERILAERWEPASAVWGKG
jgi:excisionase family DNA binding protein